MYLSKKLLKRVSVIGAAFLIIITIKANGQEVYHFPKEENFQVFGDCFNELRAIKDKAEERTSQYEADVADYKKGRFCSDCKRSATRIEREDHISFAQHIADGESHGRKQVAASKGMYDTLYMNYRADWNPMKKAYDAKFIDCQGKVKLSTDELNTTISNYDSKYNDALAQLNKIQNPQKKAELQASITQNRTAFLQYKQQAQQQLTSGDGDGMAQSLQSLQQQTDNMVMIDTDASVAARNVKIPDAKGPDTKGMPRSPAAGNRAEVSTSTPASAALTNSNQQKQQAGATNYAQKFQQWQNNNAQTQQTTNSTFDGLKNQVQQAYDQRAADREATYERDMQKLKDEQRQREEEVDQRIKTTDETNRQTTIDMDQILDYSNFNSNPPHAEKIPDNAKQSFYITYERDYANNIIMLKTYTLNKYSDGTWMSEPDIQKKINFTKYLSNSDRYTDLLGPYASRANAIMVINKIKTNASGIAGSINTDDSFAPLNKPASPTESKDFWNN